MPGIEAEPSAKFAVVVETVGCRKSVDSLPNTATLLLPPCNSPCPHLLPQPLFRRRASPHSLRTEEQCCVYTDTPRGRRRKRARVRALSHRLKCIIALGGAKQQKSCPRTQSRDTPLDQTRPAATRYMCPSPWLFAVSFSEGGGGGFVFNDIEGPRV